MKLFRKVLPSYYPLDNKLKRREKTILDFWKDSSLEIVSLITSYCNFSKVLLQSIHEKEQVNSLSILSHACNNDRIVSGCNDLTLKIWDVNSGECLKKMSTINSNNGFFSCNCLQVFHYDYVSCVAIMSDDRIVSGSADSTLKVWNADSGECLKVLKGHSGFVNCVAIMSDGHIVSGSCDHTLRVWNADSGECLKVLKDLYDVNCVVTMPGRIVSGSDKTLQVWNADSGECIQVLNGHLSDIKCVSITRDGCIVSGSDDTTLRLWAGKSYEDCYVLKGHIDNISCVAIMPDDRIVSGSWDNTLRIWNADSGECLQVLEGHSDLVLCVTIMTDGRIVSGSLDTTIKIWGEI